MNKEFKEIIVGFKRGFSFLQRPEKTALVVASALMLVAGVLTNLPALILGRLVDALVGTNTIAFASALPYIYLIIGVILAREALTVVRKFLVENVATQTEKKQTVRTIEHLLKTDTAVIAGQQIGSLHGRVFRSIQGLVRIIKLGFLDFFPVFFSALASIAIAVLQKPLLASVMILVIPTGLLIIIKQIASQKGVRVSLLRGKEKIDGAVVEMLGGIETVRVLDTVSQEVAKVEQVAESLRSKEIKHHVSMALFDAGKYLNEGLFYIFVIALSIYFASQGIITRGDILVYSILFLSITGPLREIHRILDEAHESSIRVNDLYELINHPQDVSYTSVSVSPETVQSVQTAETIQITNVSFSYPSTESLSVLKNVSLSVRSGEKIGIVGASGCGKSTLIKVLLRLVHGYSGSVRLLGADLQYISRSEIADKVAYVPQKAHIFSGSIRDNILYGNTKQGITDQEVIDSAKFASIYTEIQDSLGGLEGPVTENGNNLSGGQKQRLAIARLYLRSPELLILDEATSALDNTNEAAVQQNIEQHFQGKTIITIAHRLTTLKNSDRILVFDTGTIIQEGSFSVLANQPGLFQEFLKQKESHNA